LSLFSTGNVVGYRLLVSGVRRHAAREGLACATPASLWPRADVAVVAFADSKLPSLIFPSYTATSGDYVRSYEISPVCPKKLSRMRHKHVQVISPFGTRVNLSDAHASCLQHYVDYFKTRKCE